MGFKENLKAELGYADMRVKELAELSGVKKQTIDSYLRENGYTPSVEVAIRIAEVLNVSVEYLVKGRETKTGKSITELEPDLRFLIQSLEKLNAQDRKIIIKNALNLTEILASKSGKIIPTN